MARKVALLTTLPRSITVPYYAPSCVFLETVLRSKSIPFEVSQWESPEVERRDSDDAVFPVQRASSRTLVSTGRSGWILFSKCDGRTRLSPREIRESQFQIHKEELNYD